VLVILAASEFSEFIQLMLFVARSASPSPYPLSQRLWSGPVNTCAKLGNGA